MNCVTFLKFIIDCQCSCISIRLVNFFVDENIAENLFHNILAYSKYAPHQAVMAIMVFCIVANIIFLLINFLETPLYRLVIILVRRFYNVMCTNNRNLQEYIYTNLAVLLTLIAAIVMSVYWAMLDYDTKLIAATVLKFQSKITTN